MTNYKFIDLFAGCGGLSLGLTLAGLRGQFVIERDAMAFATFAENFLGQRKVPVARFAWPSWLERRAWAIDDLLSAHHSQLMQLRGTIDVLAGGPPCQGFSFAGKRREADPRNMLFEKYVQVVEAIQPSAIVLENVPGMKVAHSNKEDGDNGRQEPAESYYEKLKMSLEAIGYRVEGKIVDASRFGVPQRRSRLIVIGVKERLADALDDGIERAFHLLEAKRVEMLTELGLPKRKSISAEDAISDLLVGKSFRKACDDPLSPRGFEEAYYFGPQTAYQRLMHKHCSNDSMDSMRLARHGEEVRKRFAKILKECDRGVRMNEASRAKYGLKKHRIYPMSPFDPAPTITTLPDDVLHYAEPRILTVRESARLQSFPDWFRFSGKFTTGGALRTKECPRYTQVGNAVPPSLGRVIGLAVVQTLREAHQTLERNARSKIRYKQEPAAAIA